MLGAFFGPAYRDWWLSYARNPKQLPLYQNHWLVRESAARAFARGLVRLDRRQPSMIEFEVNPVFIGPEEPIEIDGPYALLGDHSRTGIMTVDARFIGTHARLSRSMRFVEIARRIAPEILAATRALLLTWLLLPSRARAAAYRTLKRLGEMIYPVPDPTLQVRRLPFGLYLKYANDADMANNEFNALRLVHQYTSIPAPKPLDLIPHHSNSLFLMTRVPGVPLWRCQDYLSDAELDAIAAQLTDYLAQLRAIPRKHFQNANPDAVISNTLGGPCRDHRIRSGDPVGPFRDEAAFSRCLRFPDDPARRGHEIVFTHADLNPRNILVDEVVLPGGGPGGG
ncbi:0c704a95-11e6-4036-93cf-00d274128476 [Thermothielavioides terrestris]|uniref:0c704a95-11e6-4036-93cf-00d274128476 n=1 Tax=Thermothielavioides terrestris TaxID=2587410 RepID=A0A3S4AS11_9PEZI|nr:0c704a95-11e6-4036-93cf-00d274128476 [Thermothielavioides terrestris]